MIHHMRYNSETDKASRCDVLIETVSWLDNYFEGHMDNALPQLKPSGTEFQTTVWRALLTIDSGTTITYGELARSIDKPQAVRSVAAAIGRNPISVLIPCHRVIGANGSLTGYAGGLERKQALLVMEKNSSAVREYV